MIAVDQNIIIVIDLKRPKEARSYSSIKKLCEANPDFPLYELYRRDKYKFPFKKNINGTNYLFVRSKINASKVVKISEKILLASGFKQTKKGEFEFMGFEIASTNNNSNGLYILRLKKKNKVDFITYTHELKAMFKAEKGIGLDLNIY